MGLHLRGEQPSDFTHASRQELELVVNSPLRRRSIPLSQLSPYKDQPVWTRVISENCAGPMFDAGLNRPEERWIVTCGIICGFSHALDVGTGSPCKPRLVEYSMQDGSIRIGVLMPKGFNPDAPITERGAAGAKRKKTVAAPTAKLSPSSERIFRRMMSGRMRIPA